MSSATILELRKLADRLDAIDAKTHALGRECVDVASALHVIARRLADAMRNPADPNEAIRDRLHELADAGETR